MKFVFLLICLFGASYTFADHGTAGALSEQIAGELAFDDSELQSCRSPVELILKSDSDPLQMLPALDQLVDDYLGERRHDDAVQAARAAFRLRLQHAASSEEYYVAYRVFGDALLGAGRLTLAAEVYRDGAELEVINPRGQVGLLVALARIGLVDRDFLRWGTRSMIRANKIANAHRFEVPALLDIDFADLLMIGGNVNAAKKIYRALWQAKPEQRQIWFGDRPLLVASAASSNSPQLSEQWLADMLYRPVIRDGELFFPEFLIQ